MRRPAEVQRLGVTLTPNGSFDWNVEYSATIINKLTLARTK